MSQSIPEAFDPDDAVARFLLSMSMAKNDIECCLHDLLRVTKEDSPDLSYRVRLMTSHLVEASLALKQYRQHEPDVSRFLRALSADAKEDLAQVMKTAQVIGTDALDRVRISTFHYPHPDPKRSPDSDELLASAVRDLGHKHTAVHVDFEQRRVHLLYAEDVAAALAFGGHSPDEDERQRQLALARDGAFAFRRFFDRALLAVGISFGEPVFLDEPDEPAEPGLQDQ